MEAKMTAKNTTLVNMTAGKSYRAGLLHWQKPKAVRSSFSSATRGGFHGLFFLTVLRFLLDAADSTAVPHFLFDRSCGTFPRGGAKESHVYVDASVAGDVIWRGLGSVPRQRQNTDFSRFRSYLYSLMIIILYIIMIIIFLFMSPDQSIRGLLYNNRETRANKVK